MKYFPYDTVRPIQEQLMKEIKKTIESKKHGIFHAPTGLGKTISSIAPALEYAIENEKTILFLTSRHTQHMIAIETVKAIKEKYNLNILTTDIIGKKAMCLIDNIDNLYSSEFFEYCKKQREDRTCEFYVNVRKGIKLTPESKVVVDEIIRSSPLSSGEIIEKCREHKLCPYEISLELAKKSKVIVGDYYYAFNPIVSSTFLKKIEKDYDDLIIIVDEGHNLPSRIRDLGTVKLSMNMLKRAIKESKKYRFHRATELLSGLLHILSELSYDLKEEKLITKKDFIRLTNDIAPYSEIIDEIEIASTEIRSLKSHSSMSTIPEFLNMWIQDFEGYTRILTKENDSFSLYYRCLDPGVILKDIIEKTHSTILMSGTLLPTEMYRDILGFPEDTITKEYPSPFPNKNRLNLIVPRTTTQFKKRNDDQYRNIADEVRNIIEAIPGNVAVFFPSYFMRDKISSFIDTSKELIYENPTMTKDEKEELLRLFKKKSSNLNGAALMACQSGSFGEGIDLPGNYLKGVVVVGLPLGKPDLVTKELIAYYDKKFNKGWDYGYVSPAFSKVLQSAGRCIRSETDKGVIVFLDERFTWPNYRKHFPLDHDYKISLDPIEDIHGFFHNN